jgi:hypothetical protein
VSTPITVTVKTIQIRRSFTPGYRPPTSGVGALAAGETLRNYADKVDYHGVGDGTWIETDIRAAVDQIASGPIADAIGGKLNKNLQIATTPEGNGAASTGDVTTAIAAAIATGKPVDLAPRDYSYSADTLDVAKLGRVPLQARLRSVVPGDALIRDKGGRVIGLSYNHKLLQDYSGTYPRNVPATAITSGNLMPPPISTASAAGPVDILAHYYGDWGLDFYRSATGIGGPAFDGWYDGRWNWPTASGYDPARRSILGSYRNDDANVLDWQCYWLREAGVKGVIPVAFDFNVSTWGNANDRNLWLFRLFNSPNFKGLSYIPWGKSTNFDNPDGAVTDTQSNIQAQWSNLWFVLAAAYPNNYVMNFAGKRWFTIYVWNMEQLRALFDPNGGAINFSAWLKTRADEVRSIGYDGLAVLSNTAVADATMSRTSLLANNVLHLGSPYSGPANSSPTAQTYAGVVAGYNPPASGQVLNVSTGLSLVAPLPASPSFAYPGATPALFQAWMTKAIAWLVGKRRLPQLLTVSNVSEWAEQGAGLHPNAQDGWGYLDAIRGAFSAVGVAGGSVKFPLTLQNGWVTASSGNEPPQVWKDAHGVVRLSGVITGGTVAAGTIVATLPPGMRPSAVEVFSVGVSGGASSVYVDTSGNIVALGSLNSATTGLSGVSFLAAT